MAACTGFEDLRHTLKCPSETFQTWRNAELFPYLNYLAFPNNIKSQYCVNALRVHCQLDQLKCDTNPDVNYWRLAHGAYKSSVEVAQFNHLLVESRFDIGWVLDIYENLVTVYRPHHNLFDDVEPALYGDQFSNKLNAELSELLTDAFGLIDQYSPTLRKNIVDQISTIALLKEPKGRPNSYSLRNRYIGAIFVSVTSATEMAEQLIHEYYHQCMWPWWLAEPPGDLPDVSMQITSPVTGAVRSLPTMVQAVLIYASLQDFYSFANNQRASGQDKAAADRARARALAIVDRFDALVVKVEEELKHRPLTRRLVDVIIDLRNELVTC